MKISGSKSTASSSAPRGARAAAGAGGFSLAGPHAAAGATGVCAAPGVGGLSCMGALLALQSVDDPLHGRRKAVVRAGRILDALDALKIALLGDGASPAQLRGLGDAVREERSRTDDPALQGLLDEIETRAAVELAKLDRAVG